MSSLILSAFETSRNAPTLDSSSSRATRAINRPRCALIKQMFDENLLGHQPTIGHWHRILGHQPRKTASSERVLWSDPLPESTYGNAELHLAGSLQLYVMAMRPHSWTPRPAKGICVLTLAIAATTCSPVSAFLTSPVSLFRGRSTTAPALRGGVVSLCAKAGRPPTSVPDTGGMIPEKEIRSSVSGMITVSEGAQLRYDCTSLHQASNRRCIPCFAKV